MALASAEKEYVRKPRAMPSTPRLSTRRWAPYLSAIPPTTGASTAARLMMAITVPASAAFPDLQVTVDSVIAEGDTLAARTTWRGTHQAEFMGVPASGKFVEFGAIDVVRHRGGKAAEHWGQSDAMSLMTQIGAMEPP